MRGRRAMRRVKAIEMEEEIVVRVYKLEACTLLAIGPSH
jgi:hypothetical protein